MGSSEALASIKSLVAEAKADPISEIVELRIGSPQCLNTSNIDKSQLCLFWVWPGLVRVQFSGHPSPAPTTMKNFKSGQCSYTSIASVKFTSPTSPTEIDRVGSMVGSKIGRTTKCCAHLAH
jgi:hypothetical protein